MITKIRKIDMLNKEIIFGIALIIGMVLVSVADIDGLPMWAAGVSLITATLIVIGAVTIGFIHDDAYHEAVLATWPVEKRVKRLKKRTAIVSVLFVIVSVYLFVVADHWITYGIAAVDMLCAILILGKYKGTKKEIQDEYVGVSE